MYGRCYTLKYKLHPHRFADSILENTEEFKEIWQEVLHIINQISDEDLINEFNNAKQSGKTTKSLSTTINKLFKQQFTAFGWIPESPIFQDAAYNNKNKKNNWRLDFAKNSLSIEVAFNHSGSIAWNLLKPVLASELNHVQKAIQTKIGVVICATNEMQKNGGFDSAIGTYEKFITYLKPLNNQLSVPIIIIGLDSPSTFRITHEKNNGKIIGNIERITK